MKFSIKVIHGELIPKWYGVSYLNFNDGRAVCHLIPLNIVVAIFQHIRWWFKRGFIKPVPTIHELKEEYNRGYTRGMELAEARYLELLNIMTDLIKKVR